MSTIQTIEAFLYNEDGVITSKLRAQYYFELLALVAKHITVYRPTLTEPRCVDHLLSNEEFIRKVDATLTPEHAYLVVGQDVCHSCTGKELRSIHEGCHVMVLVKYQGQLLAIAKTRARYRFVVTQLLIETKVKRIKGVVDMRDSNVATAFLQAIYTTIRSLQKEQGVTDYIVGIAGLSLQGEVLSLPRPNRHHHLIHTYTKNLENNASGIIADTAHDSQGFLTRDGHYVNRRQAWHIASMHEQIVRDKKTYMHKGEYELYSEHLY